MNLCRTIRACASLYEDAIDALIELVFAGTKRTAHDIRERGKAEAAERGRAAVAERRAERLAEAEAEEEVWELGSGSLSMDNCWGCGTIAYLRYGFCGHCSSPESSVAAPKVSADSATTERPAAPFPDNVEPPGTPSQRLLAAAAYGLREYADSNHCGAPTYWRSIASQLDAK